MDYYSIIDNVIDYNNYIQVRNIPHKTLECSKLPRIPENVLTSAISSAGKLYIYFDRLIKQLLFITPDSSVIYALVDNKNRILSFYGSHEMIASASQIGLKKGAFFEAGSSGINAIIVGQKERKCTYSLSSSNACSCLHKYNIFYAPINKIHHSDTGIRRQIDYGIAIFSRSGDPGNYLTTAYNIAHDLSLDLDFFTTVFNLEKTSHDAVIHIEANLQRGTYMITAFDDNFFRFFHLEKKDLFRTAANTVFNPPPENLDFWNILEALKPVTDYPITIRCGDKIKKCFLSIKNYFNETVNYNSFHIFFSSSAKSQKVTPINEIISLRNLDVDKPIGESEKFKILLSSARQMAMTDSNIILLGESGTGKDVIANYIHKCSNRKDKPFISINCAALPKELIASELFGYVPGAFTGANKSGMVGKFEAANGGTLFLDEIGDMPKDLQATLLRAVETKQITKLGSNTTATIDVKIISATNRNLGEMIVNQDFRLDLYYRLGPFKLDIPPLRERIEDIPVLMEYFFNLYSAQTGRFEQLHLTPEAIDFLKAQYWYGNIRELRALAETIAQMTSETEITPEIIKQNSSFINVFYTPSHYENSPALPKRRKTTKEEMINALTICNGNKSRAAEYLNIPRRTFYRYLEKYDLK